MRERERERERREEEERLERERERESCYDVVESFSESSMICVCVHSSSELYTQP